MPTVHDSNRVPAGCVQKPLPVLNPSWFRWFSSSVMGDPHSTLRVHTALSLKIEPTSFSLKRFGRGDRAPCSIRNPHPTCHAAIHIFRCLFNASHIGTAAGECLPMSPLFTIGDKGGGGEETYPVAQAAPRCRCCRKLW